MRPYSDFILTRSLFDINLDHCSIRLLIRNQQQIFNHNAVFDSANRGSSELTQCVQRDQLILRTRCNHYCSIGQTLRTKPQCSNCWTSFTNKYICSTNKIQNSI